MKTLITLTLASFFITSIASAKSLTCDVIETISGRTEKYSDTRKCGWGDCLLLRDTEKFSLIASFQGKKQINVFASIRKETKMEVNRIDGRVAFTLESQRGDKYAIDCRILEN